MAKKCLLEIWFDCEANMEKKTGLWRVTEWELDENYEVEIDKPYQHHSGHTSITQAIQQAQQVSAQLSQEHKEVHITGTNQNSLFNIKPIWYERLGYQ